MSPTVPVPSVPADGLRAHLRQHPDAILEAIAGQYDVTLLDALRSLPDGLATERDGRHFAEALGAIATWGDVTTVVHTADVIMEYAGPFPAGRLGRGFYNLQAHTGLKGHLRPERCGRIVFLERPFMGLATASVLFVNVDGGCMFKVFLRRDPSGALDAEQLAAFRGLAGSLA